MHACVHVCVCACMSTHTHTRMHAHTHMHVCVCVCVCVCAHTHVCTQALDVTSLTALLGAHTVTSNQRACKNTVQLTVLVAIQSYG